MPELIALRAVFGQDEANHGIRRYRVGVDGLVRVPVDAALFLLSKGGFAAAKTTVGDIRVHGFLPKTQDLHRGEREMGPEPIGLERPSVEDSILTAAP